MLHACALCFVRCALCVVRVLFVIVRCDLCVLCVVCGVFTIYSLYVCVRVCSYASVAVSVVRCLFVVCSLSSVVCCLQHGYIRSCEVGHCRSNLRELTSITALHAYLKLST